MIDTKKQTFMIDIKNNQNNTWQGSLCWIQENKTENFRSALELIRLLDSAVTQNDGEKNNL